MIRLPAPRLQCFKGYKSHTFTRHKIRHNIFSFSVINYFGRHVKLHFALRVVLEINSFVNFLVSFVYII
jgi:hypothetical protein